MRKVYAGLCALLLLAILVQFYFAAVGAFAKPQRDDSFALHDLTGMMIIPLLSILAIIAAAVARAPGRQIGLTAAPLGLVVVQVLIVTIGRALGTDGGDTTTPVALAILGLHAVNGLITMAVASVVFRRARAFATAPADPVPSPVPA
jgi:hypothetical protein